MVNSKLMSELMRFQMLINLTRKSQSYYLKYKMVIISIPFVFLLIFAYFKPQQFANLWLTKDQQGTLLFKLERYDVAAKTFTNTRWQAFSLYGDEQFEQAALLYGQYDHLDEQLAKGNALAHARRYVKARAVYQTILHDDPLNQAALTNLKIVQAIIEQVNRMSESQKSEDGDSPKELGDEPQTGEGAEKKEARVQEIEQLSAEQLLLDDKLNEMWLRQVQKDPAQFLAQKFHMQLERQNQKPISKQQESDLNATEAENGQ